MLQSTLCYLERGDAYLMLHRVKKEHDANRISGSALAASLRTRKARRTVCCGSAERRQA